MRYSGGCAIRSTVYPGLSLLTHTEFSNDLRNRNLITAADTGARPLHRPQEFDRVNRQNKKLMSRDGAWHRPQYHFAAFYPATPDGWLVKGINKVIRLEGMRIGLKIKVVEESSTSLGSLLTNPDLSGCFFLDFRMPDVGPSHLRAGANYTGVCNICLKRYRSKSCL